jgi:hypothetical protein
MEEKEALEIIDNFLKYRFRRTQWLSGIIALQKQYEQF